MCSSPKGSGKARSKTVTKIPLMNADAMERFAICANAAYERRQLRKSVPNNNIRYTNNVTEIQLKINQNNSQMGWKYWLFEAPLSELFKLPSISVTHS